MYTAGELMTKEVITVRENAPVREAIELMLRHGISGVPVVDANMRLVGMLSEKDVLSLVYSRESIDIKIVRDYMTKRPVSFEEGESVIEICNFFAKNIFRKVPITSSNEVVGIVSLPDLLKYIVHK
jgi:CBS domain-containing protein